MGGAAEVDNTLLGQYPIYSNLARAPMLSDGEIWRPLPDEGYRPEKLLAGMGWEERKTNHPKEVP